MQRVHREAVGRIVDGRARELLASLQAFPGIEPPAVAADAQVAAPVIPIGFLKDGRRLNYFSMVSTVGTPLTVAAQELRLECMFPADEETEALHAGLMSEGAAG